MSVIAHSYDDFELAQLPPRTLKNYAVKQIRALMIRGQIQPGDLLVETSLAQHLGISRSPIRQALIELESGGLVQTTVRSRRVVSLTETELDLKASLQRLLEHEAVHLAARRATQADIGMLERLARDIQMEGLNPGLVKCRDLDFRQAVWALAGNDYLANILHNLTSCLLLHSSATVTGDPLQAERIMPWASILEALENSTKADPGSSKRGGGQPG